MKVVKRYHQLWVIIECYTPGTRTVGGSRTNASVNDVHMVRKGTGGNPWLIIVLPPNPYSSSTKISICFMLPDHSEASSFSYQLPQRWSGILRTPWKGEAKFNLESCAPPGPYSQELSTFLQKQLWKTAEALINWEISATESLQGHSHLSNL